MGAKKLAGADKAAIVLLTVGDDVASEIVAHMNRDEVRRIGTALAKLGRVDPQTVESVVKEFQEQLGKNAKPALFGNAAAARRLLARAGHVVDVAGQSVPSLALDSEGAELAETLAPLSADRLAVLMRHEHPQTACLLLAHLEPARAGAVLKQLPQALGTELIRRLALLGAVEPEVLAEITTSIKQTMQRPGSQSSAARGGADKVAAVLASGALGRAAEKQLLEALAQSSPALATAVNERLFRFIDLVKIDGRGVQELLKQVSQPTLLLALRSAPDAVRLHILSQMSPRAAERFRDDLQAMPKARISDVEAAQQQIAQLARQLVEAGKIILASADDVYV